MDLPFCYILRCHLIVQNARLLLSMQPTDHSLKKWGRIYFLIETEKKSAPYVQ